VKQLGDDVKRELARFGVAAGLPELVEAWPAAVGETIARNAWPARIARDGALHVSTADSVWAFELTSRAAEIAARLGVPSVKFSPGRLPELPAAKPDEAKTRPSEPPAPARAEGERLAAAIEDENLRKIVARAAAASLARGSDDRSVW
jgi:predicted nucleic acid-binding Zn ribbon protein